ncbi:acetyl-CoA synthetase-like protein [Aspergillus steynii IBT 23096]|uniref:Acetyl-CoA synthetase-like protein n=1 Tax=Aspergillus steynii IBT 23096 TaxID=1392250 RepID=A0A2I2FSI7_9EURO|nr:acetyl-CoA synthetase-like protein [Aspergillus steynii IBT 23096]PLB43608.1 acetyl-CoA synthetase-like protein [Aspergillus steynii IBT 23096]
MAITTLPPQDYDSAVTRNQGLGQLFFCQAQQSATSVAVVDGEVSVTYRELHFLACRLAGALSKETVSREEPVGIVVQHGVAYIVAQMAVVYAGGSCVPLDPNLSDELITQRLQRLGAKTALVDAPNGARNLPFSRILVGWGVPDMPAEEAKPVYPVCTDLNHRTHIIHTSGTTSDPKAVGIAARSILHAVYHAPLEPVRRDDVVAHVNNSSFDVSLFDIWGPLLRGARIAVLHRMVLLDLPLMASHITQLGITVMATTSALLNLAATTCPWAFAKLRIYLIGGEAANAAAIGRVLRGGPPVTLVNAYGPTECCVWSLARQVSLEDVEAGTVSIGSAIGRTVIYIADEAGREVDEGELWIGGPGVSAGYINDPKRNSAAFTTVQGMTASGEPVRLYHTGDIVRKRKDGQIDYIGRVDHQVKIRGFRVDLGAVESGLLRTGLFSEAIALHVPELQQGAGSLLVAYVILSDPSSSTETSQAKQLLAKILPDYMIPQHLELVSKFPLNSHAKVDRKGLVQLFRNRWQAPSALLKSAKSEDIRTTLSRLWARILPPSRGYTYQDGDDFFTLGGTSLQASLLISQIRRECGVEVPLLALYDHSTFGSLAAFAEKRAGTGADPRETIRDERNIWLADSRLADDVCISSQAPVDWTSDLEGRVFITGATGFVGSFMLAELLRRPDVHQVGCLVRGSNTAEATQRLRKAMHKYHLWEEKGFMNKKLVVFPGNLEDRHLGLGLERFNQVANWASVIFHLGARVNYTQPYSLHRPANTIGTLNVIRLAFSGRPKSIHYMSSISCFGPTGSINGTKVVHEDEALTPHLKALPYDHGYAQSQWVVEQLLRRLMDRGAPIAIYRPGFITGHSQTGACNPDDFFSRLIQSCQEMQCYPHLPRQRKEFVPVDYVNAALLHIASNASCLGHAYHFVPSDPKASIDMDSSMELVARASECPIKALPYGEWIAKLLECTPERLKPLQPMLVEKVRHNLTRWELYESMPTYETTNTERALAGYPGGKLEFPVLGQVLMKRYIDFLASYRTSAMSNGTCG